MNDSSPTLLPSRIPLLAIIPFKENSQLRSGKNIRLFGKDPLFLISAKYAEEEGFTPVVCTDSEDVINICRERSIHYCREQADDSRAENCVIRVLQKIDCDVFALLKPTSPFRKKGLLKKMLTAIKQSKATSCLTVQKIKFSGFFDKKIHIAHSEQDNKKFFYYFDGNIFINTSDHFHEKRSFFDNNSLAYVNTFPYYLQIDTETQFKVLKHLLSMDESICWIPSCYQSPIDISNEYLDSFE